ncbi:MAG: PKD domain-containing protein [Flavobacteriales bacterium]|nr:PKD domain-containing protein [Flavobacteriales bacterium]
MAKRSPSTVPVPAHNRATRIAQYLWDWDDASVDSTSGPVASHVFDDDGEHVVQLYVTDDNDCSNLNLVDLRVLVSTTTISH